MCEDDIHPGLIVDPTVSRRTFGLTVAAVAGIAGAAQATTPVVSRDVDIKTADGVADAVVFHPEGKGPWPAVLIWPDIVSLRPVFREMGRRLAAEGYVVLVPNLYYRTRRAPVVESTFDFANADDRAKLMALRKTVTPDATERDAKTYLAYLDAQPQVDKRRKVGVQGYCMGGALSIITAATVPNRIGAVASFHGGGLATDKPDSPHLLLAKTKAEYLILWAKNDDDKDPNEKVRLKAAMDAAKRPAKIEVYPAAHGWCVKGSQVYDEAQAERAWAELLALYKRTLK
ncbi:dienelactone hydrolase family protein [Caulobacter mirabilis]|uniref:Dienelactone hydrolase n=1 Tax=Caulobacter mirabilis TaxID=69666 RepID=A0A2D2AVW5_9CAUL|nr:dienelactone hydrolase family protein [Caulobacter mirabilis]ATQ42162.1 dienelactone hydrolase [Caulobacter mirabilis]